MSNQNVNQLLDDIRLLGHEHYSLVESVRTLVKQTFPDVAEEVKYGGILFTTDVMFAGVFAYRKHVSVEFTWGARIDDLHGHLEGGGKGRRHIKLYTLDDIQAKALPDYLPLALAAARGSDQSSD